MVACSEIKYEEANIEPACMHCLKVRFRQLKCSQQKLFHEIVVLSLASATELSLSCHGGLTVARFFTLLAGSTTNSVSLTLKTYLSNNWQITVLLCFVG